MSKAGQRLDGLVRKSMQMYGMIEPGDAICVGVSGGKDSMALITTLHRLQNYYEFPFSLQAVTLDPQFGGIQADYSPITDYLKKLEVPYTVRRTNIGPVVFDERQEQNPCALCAKLRRGALHNLALELGCNKVALGHHLDDAVETFFMNLLGGGRIGCFSPVTYLSRKQITLIRPMLLATEQEVIRAVAADALPVFKSLCPADGATARQEAKIFVEEQSRLDPAFRQKMLGALQKSGIDGWAPGHSGSHRSGTADS